MADNVAITPGSGDTVAADDVGGVKFQKIKRNYGGDGADAEGLSVSKTDALVATATSVKGSAGRVHGYHIYNPNSSIAYVHFYNIASGSVTVGSSTRTITLAIPSNTVATVGVDAIFPVPILFDTAITVAATTTITGSTAPSTGLLTNVFYV